MYSQSRSARVKNKQNKKKKTKTKTKKKQTLITNLPFADDDDTLAEKERVLKALVERVSAILAKCKK